MLRFSKFDSIFGHNHNWTFNPFRRVVKDSVESEQKASGNRPTSEPDKRETPEQNESGYKRVAKKYKCVTEPFKETLKILEEIL